VAPLGQDLAGLVLGYPTGGSFQINSSRTQQAKYFATFIQDDFRVRPNFTINMGCVMKAISAPRSATTAA